VVSVTTLIRPIDKKKSILSMDEKGIQMQIGFQFYIVKFLEFGMSHLFIYYQVFGCINASPYGRKKKPIL
jgi:hypothetical protein